MFGAIKPHHYVALRLPSDTVKVEQILPNTLISLGKYGSFHSNQIIGRPYYLTFEILDRAGQRNGEELRVVSATEIHAESLLDEAEPELAEETSSSTPAATQFDEFGLPSTVDKSNVNITDDPMNQKLTYAEIEALKSDQLAHPKELIAKIMANHSQLDKKTAFSLAKYTVRKQKKYMKRFTVLPLDVATLADWMMNEKDFAKIMEIRNEMVGLMGSWANVHASGAVTEDEEPRCRYLVVDDTGGLVVATVAERMGILHHQVEHTRASQLQEQETDLSVEKAGLKGPKAENAPRRAQRHDHPLAISNTITLVHTNQQPNLSLLRYFSFDPAQPPSASDPAPHPLHTHLHSLSWLQLLQPELDTTYSQEPPAKTQEELQAMKANHRSNYHRKRRRWQRAQQIVNTTLDGRFDGLIIASFTDSVTICNHLVPLLRGGAQVVVYNPHIEPLMDLCDVYSTARRTAYLNEIKERQRRAEEEAIDGGGRDVNTDDGDEVMGQAEGGQEPNSFAITDDLRFPVDPTLLLTPTIHHSHARPWQVLPGRTHPLMTGKGGAEGGYVLVSTRVIPVQGMVVQARGRQGKSRKRQTQGGDMTGTEFVDGIDADRAAKRGRLEEREVEQAGESAEDGVPS